LENINYIVFVNGVTVDEKCTTVESRKRIEHEIEQLNGDVGNEMELQEPGSVNDELDDTSMFGMTLYELLKCDRIVMGHCYDSFDDPDKYEVDFCNVPVNQFGMKPSFVFGVMPVDYLDRKSIDDFMRSFIELHYDFGNEYSLNIEWKQSLSDEQIEGGWKSCIEQMEHFANMIENGEELKVVYDPMFLAQMIGDELIQEYVDRGMIYGELLGDDTEDILLTFEDGHTELLKDDNEFNEDHFSDPKI
jgi:hypothetical protein